MADEEEDFGEAELHLAATRPAMVPVIQIPWTAMVILIGISAMAAEFYWVYVTPTFLVWAAGFYVFRKDHNGLRVFGAWLRTAFLDMAAWWFGGTSVEVFPSTYTGRFRGIPDADT